MGSAALGLELRVVLVTTRAALRHVGSDDDGQRAAIIDRGRSLIEGIAARSNADGEQRATIDQALAELDSLSTS